MSYEENRISDQIESGLQTEQELITNEDEYIQALLKARQTEKDPKKRAAIKQALFLYAYGNGPESLKALKP